MKNLQIRIYCAARWCLAGGLIGIAGFGIIVFHSSRPSDFTSNTTPAIEMPSFDAIENSNRQRSIRFSAPVSSAELSPNDLAWLIREKLADDDGATRELVCSNEWMALWEADASTARELFEEISNPVQRERLLEFFAEELVKLDGSNAVLWAESLSDSSERKLALKLVCSTLVKSDPQRAIQVADREFVGEQHELMLREISHRWALQNLDEALSWAELRSPDENRDKLLLEIALAASESDPARAAEITADHISPGAIQGVAALSILDQWAQSDFASASDWLSRFPEGNVRDQAVLHLGHMAFYETRRDLTQPASE